MTKEEICKREKGKGGQGTLLVLLARGGEGTLGTQRPGGLQ